MCVQVVGLGYREYFSSPTNIFDSFLVIISLVELMPLLEYALCLLDDSATLNSCNGEGSGLTVLRALRLARLLRLVRNMPNIRKQLKVIGRTLSPLLSLCFLLFVIVIIFTSVGSYVYAGGMTEPASRKNLVLGALVWVWGPTIPARITDKYPGFPARVATVDVKARPQRPLGVEILTSFGEGRLVKGRQWVSVDYGQDADPLFRRRCLRGRPNERGWGCRGGRRAQDGTTASSMEEQAEEGEIQVRGGGSSQAFGFLSQLCFARADVEGVRLNDVWTCRQVLAEDSEEEPGIQDEDNFTPEAWLGQGLLQNGEIVAVLPRTNFADPVTGALTVVQIILLEGWVEIFEEGVGVAGLWMSVGFFFIVLLVGRYMVGSLAISTIIIGYNSEQMIQARHDCDV